MGMKLFHTLLQRQVGNTVLDLGQVFEVYNHALPLLNKVNILGFFFFFLNWIVFCAVYLILVSILRGKIFEKVIYLVLCVYFAYEREIMGYEYITDNVFYLGGWNPQPINKARPANTFSASQFFERTCLSFKHNLADM